MAGSNRYLVYLLSSVNLYECIVSYFLFLHFCRVSIRLVAGLVLVLFFRIFSFHVMLKSDKLAVQVECCIGLAIACWHCSAWVACSLPSAINIFLKFLKFF